MIRVHFTTNVDILTIHQPYHLICTVQIKKSIITKVKIRTRITTTIAYNPMYVTGKPVRHEQMFLPLFQALSLLVTISNDCCSNANKWQWTKDQKLEAVVSQPQQHQQHQHQPGLLTKQQDTNAEAIKEVPAEITERRRQ